MISKIDELMKKKFIFYGFIILFAIICFFAFYQFQQLKSFFQQFMHLISPFIIGFSIAFLLNQPMLWIESNLLNKLKLDATKKRVIASLLALILGLFVVGIFLWLVIPQLLNSIFQLVESFPSHVDNFRIFMNDILIKLNISVEEFTQLFAGGDVLSKLSDIVTQVLPNVIQSSFSFVGMLFNFVLGIMAAMYMLVDQERLKRHVKISVFAIFPKDVALYFVHVSSITKEIFNNFIIGKSVDSLIIGILCYIGMTMLQLPYAILLSVFVGVTNMIPVFGPFIGAVPGFFILLVIHPIYSLYFLLFILLLQQFDGNILGPLILGDKLGLPSLWILFSVCVGGGMFGIVGMFIGVPIFAVIYTLLKEVFHQRIRKKALESYVYTVK